MRQKKIPLRKCSGCGEMKPKYELVRVVKAPDVKDEQGKFVRSGEVSLDLTGKKSGRGAYVCKNSDCLEKAIKAKRFERAFSCKIPEEIYIELQQEMRENE